MFSDFHSYLRKVKSEVDLDLFLMKTNFKHLKGNKRRYHLLIFRFLRVPRGKGSSRTNIKGHKKMWELKMRTFVLQTLHYKVQTHDKRKTYVPMMKVVKSPTKMRWIYKLDMPDHLNQNIKCMIDLCEQ